MFSYKDLYAALGNLYYAVAVADGKVRKEEKDQIEALVNFSWKHFEDSTDEFATDAANIILFQFDVNEAELTSSEDAFRSFEMFFAANAAFMNHHLREKIMSSARRVAEATRRINEEELHLLLKLKHLLDTEVEVH